jgi:hypothetical protein
MTQEVLFERRIESPITGLFEAQLEAFTRPSGKWRKLGKWQMMLTPAEFSELIHRSDGVGISFYPTDYRHDSAEDEAPELLKRISVAVEDLPEYREYPPSYLDYRDDEEEKGDDGEDGEDG